MCYSFADDALLSIPRSAEGQATLTQMALETGAVTQAIRTHKVTIKHWPFPRLDAWGWIFGTVFILFFYEESFSEIKFISPQGREENKRKCVILLKSHSALKALLMIGKEIEDYSNS